MLTQGVERAHQRALQCKQFAYLVAYLPLTLPWAGLWLAATTGDYHVWGWFTPIIVFGLIPVLDYLLGRDRLNPTDTEARQLSQQRFYRALTLACAPLQFISLGAALWVLPQLPDAWSQVAWIISIGVVSSAVAINVGHELIHKNERLEQWAGAFLLASTCYAGFKVEHLRGHHVQVSTPEDASSARYGQSLFHFLPRAICRNMANAFRLEAMRLTQRGQGFWSRHNELLPWYAVSVLLAIVAFVLAGWMGVAFFFGQSLVAIVLLETVNYIEHYGLHRRQDENGRYERVTHQHSWNANHLLSNLLLFHLQRHSDHHAFPKRRYQVLRHFDDSPQLPGGYMAMIVLAWIPWAWFKVINPRVEAYYGGKPQ